MRQSAGCLLRQHDDPVNPLIKDSEWGVLEECSRAQLMWALQQRLPPSVMIPDSRLEALVEQALESQVNTLVGLVPCVRHAVVSLTASRRFAARYLCMYVPPG